MKKIISLLALIISNVALSQADALKTPRLISTGGASAGSLLVEESAFANPASIAFHQTSSFYYQRTNFDIAGEATGTNKGPTNGNSIVISDTSGPVKGNISYQQQSNFNFDRTRFTSTLAGITSGNQSYGLLYRFTKDRIVTNNLETKRTFHQVVLGMTQVFSDSFTLGAYLVDPFKANKNDALGTIGIQYVFFQQLYLLADVEGNYLKSFSDTLTWKAGAQLLVFENIFLRVGKYSNKNLNTEGTGWGLGWSGPNLSLNFGVGSARKLDQSKPSIIENNETYQEASLSLSVKV